MKINEITNHYDITKFAGQEWQKCFYKNGGTFYINMDYLHMFDKLHSKCIESALYQGLTRSNVTKLEVEYWLADSQEVVAAFFPKCVERWPRVSLDTLGVSDLEVEYHPDSCRCNGLLLPRRFITLKAFNEKRDFETYAEFLTLGAYRAAINSGKLKTLIWDDCVDRWEANAKVISCPLCDPASIRKCLLGAAKTENTMTLQKVCKLHPNVIKVFDEYDWESCELDPTYIGWLLVQLPEMLAYANNMTMDQRISVFDRVDRESAQGKSLSRYIATEFSYSVENWVDVLLTHPWCSEYAPLDKFTYKEWAILAVRGCGPIEYAPENMKELLNAVVAEVASLSSVEAYEYD